MCSLEIKKGSKDGQNTLLLAKKIKKKPHVRTKKLTSLETAHTAL